MFLWFSRGYENIHSETYSLLIDTYINDESEKDRCLTDHTIPVKRRLNGL